MSEAAGRDEGRQELDADERPGEGSSTLEAATDGRAATAARRDRITLIVAFVVGTVLYLWRVWDRLVNTGIFAEDAAVFYLQAELIGPGAIFRPYAGYLHFVPRLGAAVVEPFGLPAVPLGYALITTSLTLAGFSLVLSRRLERFIPTAWGRGLAFVALCLVPQFSESATSLAYLIFIGGVPLVLLGLSRSPTTWWGRVLEGIAVAALGLSGPLIVFYSPLFAYRWLRDRTWPNAGLAGIAGITAAIQIAVYLGYGRDAGNFGFDLVPRVYLQRVVGELLASPSAAESAFNELGALRTATVVFLAVVVIVALIEVRWDAAVALGVTAFAFAWAVRTYGIAFIYPYSGNRHMLVPASILLITMVAALSHAVNRALTSDAKQRWFHGSLAVLAGIGLLATTIGGVRASALIPRYDHIPTRDELTAFQACIDEGRRDCVPVPYAPVGRSLDANHPWDPSPY